jgi:transcription termination factor Rho
LTALSQGFSSQFPSGKPAIPNSQGNLESDRIVAKVIEAITPLFTAQEAKITASIKAIQISVLSKIAALTKTIKAQDEKIAVLEVEISKNSI